jgi:fructose-bisphosphate aldolase, class I
MNVRPTVDQIGLSAGKKTRLYRILREHGLRNGTAMFLPHHHGPEHGPRDFSGSAEAGEPKHIIGLALEGGFNGIAVQIGLARKFYWHYAGEVPLVLKLNGKTDIPSAADPLSSLNATVEDAVRLGTVPQRTRCMSARLPRSGTSRSTCGCARTPSGSACR